jgi:pimeloyl-ACP methyl ester carboxylesterase
VRIDFTPDPSLYPFESHWFESYAGQMHYVDEGAGPPILFCHGNPTWSFLYRKVITRLRGSFRCIAVDYLGFGLSERPGAYGYTTEEHARCVGEMPRQLLSARPLLERLASDVPAALGAKPALLVWGMKDLAFRPAHLLPRMQAAFASNVTVRLPHARHYIQEDAPDEIARAIIKRFT